MHVVNYDYGPNFTDWSEVFPHFENALYNCLIIGSRRDSRFCFELVRSGLLQWLDQNLSTLSKVDVVQVCILDAYGAVDYTIYYMTLYLYVT